MIAAVAERRADADGDGHGDGHGYGHGDGHGGGDWRGACAAADVDVCLKPDSVRRHHGAQIAGQVLATLRDLAPDLLRWHLPRRGHGPGDLLPGLLVPLAEFADGTRQVTLAAATPRFALDAGQRIVLVLLGGREDRATSSVLEGVRLKNADRFSLVRHRFFWSASAAPELAGLCDVSAAEREITRFQDAGLFAQAWHAAGFELCFPATASRTRWLAALPIRMAGLADRVRSVLPGVDEAVVRSGVGALALSGLNSACVVVRMVGDREALGLPVIPNVVWSRVLDADLLRLGYLGDHELHPLIAEALFGGVQSASEPDEWLYREVPFIAGPDGAADGGLTLWIRCGATSHRIGYRHGTWQILDHTAHAGREALLSRLGGPTNPCQQALDYLTSGRHIVDLAEALLNHGRGEDVRRLIHQHAGAGAMLSRITLPGGGPAATALETLRENTLRHRMILAEATRTAEPERWRARKGDPARVNR